MRKYLAYLFASFVLFSTVSNAATFYWHSSTGGTQGDFASASLLCSANWSANTWDHSMYADPTTVIKGSNANCQVKYSAPEYSGRDPVVFESAYLYGDSCPAGSTYDPLTGGCKSAQGNGELCSDQTGSVKDGSGTTLVPMIYSGSSGGCVLLTNADDSASCKYMSGLPTNGTSGQKFQVEGTSNDIGLGVAPLTFIQDGLACELSTLVTTSCKVKADGTSTCVVTAKLTGNVATPPTGTDSASKQACISAGGCSPVDLTPQTTYTDSGCADKGNCVQETKSDTSGSQSCITSGSLVCNNTKPTSTETKTSTSTASKSNSDGSVTSAVTADTTTTKCTDVNSCKSSTTSTKTTSVTTASGSTSTSSTCTGSCNGKGTATTPGEGDDDENTDEGSASASDDCKVPPPCDGDPFSCALLKQAWIDSCAVRALPTVAQKADADAAIAKQVSALDANQKELDDSVTSLVSGFQAATSTSVGGQCFTDKTFSVQGYSITLPFSQTCPYLEWLRYGVLCLAYLVALRIVTKEI